MQRAEVLHAIFQAACRSGIRSGSGQQVHLYLMAARSSGIRPAIRQLFPRCQILPWRQPVIARPSRRVQEALNVIDTMLAHNPGADLPFKQVRAALRMTSPQFTQHIRQDQYFKKALAKSGIQEAGGKTRKRAFRRTNTACPSGCSGPGTGIAAIPNAAGAHVLNPAEGFP